MAVSVLHLMVAMVVFEKTFISLFQAGIFNTVGTNPVAGVAVWFAFFGLILWVLGMAVDALESLGISPRPIGWGLMVMIIIGVVLMPASGFWLAIPPAIALLRTKNFESAA